MVTRPKRKQAAGRGRTASSRTGTSRAKSAAPAEPRERIIDAFMMLVGERGLMNTGLADIARAADVSLAELRGEFPGKLAILAAFSKRIDAAVLAQGPAEGEGAKDRLFDILMRRLDALAPYKPALRQMVRTARRSPGFAAVLNVMTRRSQRWMHAAAGIERGGITGAIARQGGVLVFAETLAVWLKDDDPDLARTMKTLDRALGRGDRAMRLVNDICGAVCRMGGPMREAAEQRAAG